MVESLRAQLRRHIYVTAALIGPPAIFIGFLAAILGWALFPDVGWVRLDEDGDEIPLLHIAIFSVVWIFALYLLSAAVLGKRISLMVSEEHRAYAPPGSFPRRPRGNGYWMVAAGSGIAVFFIVAAAMGWLT